ncbi:SMP-30/gluconolactonase/LRE family protein [Chloroflexota bacterium]
MAIDIDSPSFKRIAQERTIWDRIAYGGVFTEGPVWHSHKGYLVWVDIIGDTIWKWVPGEGASILLRPSSKANGTTYDRQGRLVVAGWSSRTIWRIEHDGSIVTLASHYKGKKLGTPNDIVVKSDGAIYFTDGSGGLTRPGHESRGADLQRYLDFNGIYRIDPEDGTLTLLVNDFENPNGLTFSPDESALYINDSMRRHIRVFDVNPDGTISNGRLFTDVTGDDYPGSPDGMKVDVEGNVYCTGPGGIHVFDTQANYLGRIRTPEQAQNFCWGDKDWKSLYITARGSVYRTRLKIPGVPVAIVEGLS